MVTMWHLSCSSLKNGRELIDAKKMDKSKEIPGDFSFFSKGIASGSG
jgi:hypothetical protein